MSRMVRRCIACIVLSLPTVALGGDEDMLDRVEVTGSRITYRDLLETPAISLTKQGDHLLLGFTLTNDTRDAELRRKELTQTIEGMLARTGPNYQLLLDDAFRTPVGRPLRIEYSDDAKRSDVNQASLQLRTDIAGEPSKALATIEAMRKFLKDSTRVGRTEIVIAGETALVMNRPERYRYDLIAAIAADTQRVAAILGEGCEVELEGLNSRIEWQRVSASELLLYVPYTMIVSGCRTGAAAAAKPGASR